MKKTAFVALLFTFAIVSHSCAQTMGQITFVNKDSAFDFGEIAEGTGSEYAFEIKNTGTEPLTITAIKSDDSTDLKYTWPTKAIKPGKKGTITIIYRRKARGTGSFDHDVFITSSATQEPYPFIHIKGAVVPFRENMPDAKTKKGKNNFDVEMKTETYDDLHPH